MQWLLKHNLISAIMQCNHESYSIFHVNKIASPLHNTCHVTSSFGASDLNEEPFFPYFPAPAMEFYYFKTISLQPELRLELVLPVLNLLFYLPTISRTG